MGHFVLSTATVEVKPMSGSLFDHTHPLYRKLRAVVNAPVDGMVTATYLAECTACRRLGVLCGYHKELVQELTEWQPGTDDQTETIQLPAVNA